MQLVILAGGKGTRLGLANMPKPMCPVAGKPLLERQIEMAKSFGIDEIFILSGYMANVIVDYFGDGSKWGVKIHHVIEDHPLGTAGAVKLVEKQIKDRFMVFYGDVVMNFDMDRFVDFDSQDKSSVGTIVVHPNNHPYDTDLVEVENGYVQGFLSKPHPENLYYNNLGNAALYIFSPEIFKYIKTEQLQDFGKDILPKVLADHKKLKAYKTPEYIKDMGTKDRLAQISNEVESGYPERRNLKNKQKAIFLDRDGTINVNMDTHPTVEGFQLLPGVADAVRLINEAGYLAIVVTNQPMIAKGFMSFETLNQIHQKMETLLGNEKAYLDAIYYCPHHPDQGFEGEVKELKFDCDCRKPKPGMLLQAQRDFNLDLSQCWMIGDGDNDVLAGQNAGCQTIKLTNEKNLLDAVQQILGEQK